MIYSFAPDIVITDAMMPGLSGFDLIREVKSRPETARIPVILLTSLEAPNGGVMDASGKADISLSKPFTSADILTAVQRAQGMLHTLSDPRLEELTKDNWEARPSEVAPRERPF
jgi:CheY-like chemotaxis protein